MYSLMVFIIFLQETLVLEDRLGDLAFIDEKYDSIGIGAIYSERAISASSGRAEGGLACLWKRDGNFKILKIILEDKLLALQMQIGSHCILLVNVYVKSDLWEVNTHNEYLEYFGPIPILSYFSSIKARSPNLSSKTKVSWRNMISKDASVKSLIKLNVFP